MILIDKVDKRIHNYVHDIKAHKLFKVLLLMIIFKKSKDVYNPDIFNVYESKMLLDCVKEYIYK